MDSLVDFLDVLYIGGMDNRYNKENAMKILFATPHYNSWCHVNYAYSLYKTKWPQDSQVQVVSCMGCSAGKALDNFAKTALEGNYDVLAVACNDAGWQSDAVCRLIADDKDVVSGWSSSRFHPFEVKAFTSIDRENVRMNYRRGIGTGLERVYSVAGELQVYKVDVFRRIKYPWFEGINNPLGEPTTDDFCFGCKAFDCNIEIFVDWSVELSHLAEGMFTVGGKLRAQ